MDDGQVAVAVDPFEKGADLLAGQRLDERMGYLHAPGIAPLSTDGGDPQIPVAAPTSEDEARLRYTEASAPTSRPVTKRKYSRQVHSQRLVGAEPRRGRRFGRLSRKECPSLPAILEIDG